MTLLQNIKVESKPAAAGNRQANTFGLVLQVLTSELIKVLDKEKNEQVDALKLVGKALNSNSSVTEGQELVVQFRGNLESAISNFKKGQGRTVFASKEAAKDSTVTLEACYLTGTEEDGRKVISSRWVNTLTAKDEPAHANRSFVCDVYATAPRISFDNPNPAPGEPKKITLPVNAKAFEVVVEAEGQRGRKEFSRDWAAAKLAELKPNANLKVTIDQVTPSDAVKIGGATELGEAMAKQLGAGTRALALLRVTDGTEVMTRLVYVPFKKEGEDYVPDVEKAQAELTEKNIFKGVPNDKLWAGVEAGALTMEAIPGYRMTYAGNPHKDDNAAFKLVSDVKKDNLARYELMFGPEPTAYAKVILPGIARNESVDGFSPTNVIADEPGQLAPAGLVTAFIGKRAAAEHIEDAGLDDADPEPQADTDAHEESSPRP